MKNSKSENKQEIDENSDEMGNFSINDILSVFSASPPITPISTANGSPISMLPCAPSFVSMLNNFTPRPSIDITPPLTTNSLNSFISPALNSSSQSAFSSVSTNNNVISSSNFSISPSNLSNVLNAVNFPPFFGNVFQPPTFFSNNVIPNFSPALNIKRKRRVRTIYNESQLQILENAYISGHYPDMTVREKLAKQCNLKEERVEVWFKNRRAKERKNNRNPQKETNKRLSEGSNKWSDEEENENSVTNVVNNSQKKKSSEDNEEEKDILPKKRQKIITNENLKINNTENFSKINDNSSIISTDNNHKENLLTPSKHFRRKKLNKNEKNEQFDFLPSKKDTNSNTQEINFQAPFNYDEIMQKQKIIAEKAFISSQEKFRLCCRVDNQENNK